MGVWADEEWSLICGLKKPSTSAFPSNFLCHRWQTIYVKLNTVIF